MRDRAFLEDPGVAVGIVEEAVSGLVQRQENGAQKEGAHSFGGRASGGVPYRHRDVRLPEFLPVIGPLDDVVVVALVLRSAAREMPRRILAATAAAVVGVKASSTAGRPSVRSRSRQRRPYAGRADSCREGGDVVAP
jgi:hypothetical protein